MPRGTNSQSIRDYLADHPEATTAEVIEGLSKQKIEVSGQLVANTKHRMKYGGQQRSRLKGNRRPARLALRPASPAAVQEATIARWADTPAKTITLGGPNGSTITASVFLPSQTPKASSIPAAHILAANESAKRLGGTERLREALGVLESLQA